MLMGDVEDYSKPLFEDLINVDVSTSPTSSDGNKPDQWDSTDIRLDITQLESTSVENDDDEQDESISKKEWCRDWGLEDLPGLPDVSPVDPFRSSSYFISGIWEWLKMIICVPLLILRLLLIGLSLCVGYVCTKLALFGWKRNNVAMPRWRRHLMWGTRASARGILFCFGFHWIKRIGKPAPREVAPILVSNHVSFIDPIFYFFELCPTIVSSTSHNDMIFVGTIIRSMQVILVDRLSQHSRKAAVDEIKRRAVSNEFPRVLLFPEGTTTNGRSLISFRPGAFVPGFPVQPVVVRYPHVHFDVSWGSISLLSLMSRMLLQFHNFMEVQYLPVIYPSAHEKCHPRDFAERVRNSMARSLNVPETEHTFDDVLLSARALMLKMSPSTSFTLEMGKLETQLQLTAEDALHYLEKFAAVDSSRSGLLTRSEFLPSFGLSNDSFGKQVFALFDRKGHDSVTFQEFVAASVCLSRHSDFAKLAGETFESLDTDKDEVLLTHEIEKAMQSTFPASASETLVHKLCMDQATRLDRATFQLHLSRNPELIFPLALAAKNRLQQQSLRS